MRDTDGNIGNERNVVTDQYSGLLFDISQQANVWTTTAGAAVKAKLENTVVELNKLEDAVALGLKPYGDEGAFMSGVPYKLIKDYFNRVGNSGRLWISFADCSSDWSALTTMQRVAKGVINQFGVWTEQYLWTGAAEGEELYSLNLVADLNAVAESLGTDYFSPAVVLLSANTSKVKTGASTTAEVALSRIPTCITGNRRVTCLLSQSSDPDTRAMQGALASTTPVGSLGYALGSVAVANVAWCVGWVEMFDQAAFAQNIEFGFGNTTVVDGHLTESTPYEALTKRQLDDLDDKGYMFLRTLEGLEGHTYFNGDPTCSDGDYDTIARNRTINKTRRLVRIALLPDVNSPQYVNPSNGQLAASAVTRYNNLISGQLSRMQANGEISGYKVNVPASQNILRTKKLVFSFIVVPIGCAKSIEVSESMAVNI